MQHRRSFWHIFKESCSNMACFKNFDYISLLHPTVLFFNSQQEHFHENLRILHYDSIVINFIWLEVVQFLRLFWPSAKFLTHTKFQPRRLTALIGGVLRNQSMIFFSTNVVSATCKLKNITSMAKLLIHWVLWYVALIVL